MLSTGKVLMILLLRITQPFDGMASTDSEYNWINKLTAPTSGLIFEYLK